MTKGFGNLLELAKGSLKLSSAFSNVLDKARQLAVIPRSVKYRQVRSDAHVSSRVIKAVFKRKREYRAAQNKEGRRKEYQ